MTANLIVITPAFPAPYSEVVYTDLYKIQKNVYDVSKTLTAE